MFHRLFTGLAAFLGIAAAADVSIQSGGRVYSHSIQLTPGVAQGFGIPATSSLTMACCFSIAVPEGATRLRVVVQPPSGVQFAIGIKYGTEFEEGRFDTDYGGTIRANPEPLEVTRFSNPPLRAGIHYIAIVVTRWPSGGRGTVVASISTDRPVIESPQTLDFGTVALGQNREMALAIRNTGNEPLTVNTISSSSAQFRAVSPATPFSVVTSGERAATIRFEPTAAGPQTATLTIASTDPFRQTVTVSLSGTGFAPPTIAISVTSLTFNAQSGTNPPPQTLTIRNSGSGTLAYQIAATQPWLSVSPASGTSTGAANTVTVTVNTAGLAGGSHTGELRVSQAAPAAGATLNPRQAGAAVVAVRLVLTDVATVSAATFAAGSPVAAESIVSAFGQGLALTTEVATAVPLPTSLAGTSVRIRDSAGTERLAPLFFVSAGQVNYLVPPGTQPGAALLTVTVGERVAGTGRLQVARVAPGLFTANASGRGVAATLALRVRQGGAQSVQPVFQCGALPGSCYAAPVDLGPESDQLFLLLFGTGFRGASSPSAIRATIGGEAAEVLGAAPQGEFVGLDQVNLRLSRSLIGRGEVNVVLTVDGATANTVTVNIGPATPIRVENARTSRTTGGTGCQPPTEVTSFLTTDERAYAWWLVRNVRTGDTATAEWYLPNGSLFNRFNFAAATRDGAFCYGPFITIAGNRPASSPGIWTARVLWNGLLLLSQSFLISAPAAVTESLDQQ